MTALVSSVSHLGPAITEYLALKRALGRGFRTEAWVLAAFDRFLAMRSDPTTALTADNFTEWSLSLQHLSPTSRRSRMRIVRNLCLHMRRTDPTCFVPDLSTFPRSQPPARPYIFTESDIVRLLQAASELTPRSTSPLHGESYRIAVVLLYTVGLRRGELVRLTLSDYDPVERTLLIRVSKFHKSRVVALSLDAGREMERYLAARRRLPHGAQSPLLVSSYRGLRPRSGPGLGHGMRRLFRSAGIRTATGRLPRVHDLRHTHAVHALLRWYRAGVDVQARLPSLATSMGHVSVVSTAYYLALLEPVAEAASERFALHSADIFAHLTATEVDR